MPPWLLPHFETPIGAHRPDEDLGDCVVHALFASSNGDDNQSGDGNGGDGSDANADDERDV